MSETSSPSMGSDQPPISEFSPILREMGVQESDFQESFEKAGNGDLKSVYALQEMIEKAAETGLITRLPADQAAIFMSLMVHVNRMLATNLRASVENAHTDSLTGIPNRRAFENALRQAHAASARDGIPRCVIMVDLAGLKSFNDSLSPEAGDRAIRRAGQIIQDFTREGETAARIGGDEFALVATNSGGDPHFYDSVVQRLDTHLKRNGFFIHEGEIRQMSFYVAAAEIIPDTPCDQSLNEAGRRLNDAKLSAKQDRSSFDVSPVDPTAVPEPVREILFGEAQHPKVATRKLAI